MIVTLQGYGVVGRATEQILRAAGHSVRIYDPQAGFCDAREAYLTVVCTPCRYGYLPTLVPSRTYVVRSTVLPDAFNSLPPGERYHWPEFLTERTAFEDALLPDKIIWGSDGQERADDLARLLLGKHYKAAPVLHTSLRASCLIKLGINTAYALKVLMANALYDAAGDVPTYEQIVRGIGLDQRLRISHCDVWQDGYRGFDGKCLPKDLRLLTDLLSETSTAVFLHAATLANTDLRESTTPLQTTTANTEKGGET